MADERGYIILDGKKYQATGRVYEPKNKKSQRIGVGLTGKTMSQQFEFTDWTGRVRILVYQETADPDYGSLVDLRTAYAKAYITFVDQLENSFDVFMLGELPEPYGLALVDRQVPLTIELNLRKRQV